MSTPSGEDQGVVESGLGPAFCGESSIRGLEAACYISTQVPVYDSVEERLVGLAGRIDSAAADFPGQEVDVYDRAVTGRGDQESFSNPGPRDELVTNRLLTELEQLGAELKVLRDLDPAEAPARLARHVNKEIVRRLDTQESAEEQTRRVNRVFRDLNVGDEGDEISLPPQVLYGIKGRSAAGDALDLPPSPAILT